MKRKELCKRYGVLAVGLFFSALGVAVTKRGELGVSPISSVANVLSCRFPALSLGSWLVIWNCVLILGQILIRKREFQPIQLLQLPLSFLFGAFTDFGVWLVSGVPVTSYPVCLALIFAGICLVGFGVFLSVSADVIMNSGEAFVKAVSDGTGKEFGNVKVAFDVSCVVAAVALSLLLFDFTVVGTREGTVLSAVCTGMVVKFFSRRLKEPVREFLVR